MNAPAHLDNLRRRVSVAGAWTLGARITLAASGFLVNLLLARLMTPEEFGLYLLAVSVVSVLILGGQLGLQISVVRRVAEALAPGARMDPSDLMLKIALLGLGGGAACGLIYAMGGYRIATHVLDAPSLAQFAAIMALWAALAAPLGILAEAFRASQQYWPAALFNGLSSALILLICVLPMFLAGHTLRVDLLLNLCAGATATSLLMAFFHVLAGRGAVTLRVNLRSAELLRSSVPLMLMSLATVVTTQADLWVVGAHLDKSAVAAYGVAARLLQLVLMPLLILNAVLGPTIAQLHAEGAHMRLERLLGATAAVGAIPGLVVLTIFVASAAPILSGLYGDAYGRGAFCLVLLSAGQLVNTLCGPAATVLMMCGRERAVMTVSLCTAALTVMGGMLLVPHFGMEGVAGAAALAAASHGLFCLGWVRRTLGIWTTPNFNGLKDFPAQWRTLRRGQ